MGVTTDAERERIGLRCVANHRYRLGDLLGSAESAGSPTRSVPCLLDPVDTRLDLTVALVTAGSLFLIVCIIGMAVGLGSLFLRQRRESPTRDWIRNQPVLFEAKAAVLVHARGMQGNGWGTLKGPGWPRLVVHLGGIEATIGSFGDGLVSGNAMLIEGATMSRDRLSTFPFVAGDLDCIRLVGNDGMGPREWKVSPRDTSIDELWAQLLAAGVTPTA